MSLCLAATTGLCTQRKIEPALLPHLPRHCGLDPQSRGAVPNQSFPCPNPVILDLIQNPQGRATMRRIISCPCNLPASALWIPASAGNDGPPRHIGAIQQSAHDALHRPHPYPYPSMLVAFPVDSRFRGE